MKARQIAPNSIGFILFAGLSAFCVYFSMYAFRKPFTAATFESVEGWGSAFDFKIVLIFAQVFGYALSKFIGIRFVSEVSTSKRGFYILSLIFCAWGALIGFAILPAPYNILMLFLNGLPLGLIWGLVFSYLEGRRTTELLGAILCASFIVSSGIVKSIATWLMVDFGVTEFWMPAATGALFLPLLAVSVFGLTLLPRPDKTDQEARVKRAAMSRSDRSNYLRKYGVGVFCFVSAYVLFTGFRDFRDNFAADIWADLGYSGVASVFTLSELPIAAVVLVALSLLIFVNDNKRAFELSQLMIGGGALLIGFSTLLFQVGLIDPLIWMISSGAGLYLAYTPFNAILFERLIAVSGQTANVGFLIYLADASGYLGSVLLLLFKHFGATDLDWLPFFINIAYLTSILSLLFLLLAFLSFRRQSRSAKIEDSLGLNLKTS